VVSGHRELLVKLIEKTIGLANSSVKATANAEGVREFEPRVGAPVLAARMGW